MRQRFVSQAIGPYLLVGLMFVATLAVSIGLIIDRVGRESATAQRAIVAATVEDHLHRLGVTAEDNAVWDDAARAVYGGFADRDFLWSSWGVATADGVLFDTLFVATADGRVRYAYRRGRPSRLSLADYGVPMRRLTEAARKGEKAYSGVLKTPDGWVMAAASPVLPTSSGLDGLLKGTDAAVLVVTRPVDAHFAASLARTLGIDGIEITAPVPPGPDVHVLRDPVGVPVAALRWPAPAPGMTALEDVLPWIVLAALGHLAVAALVTRRALGAADRMARHALIDSLSRLPNRRALRRELSDRLARGEPLALAMIDLDGFKAVNDNYGHSIGDRLIKQVAVIFSDIVGPAGLVARLGGDEFAILVPGLDASTVLQMRAHDILAKLSKPFRIDERTMLIGASIGLASSAHRDMTDGELMRRADVAMYEAKRSGKMRLCWYDEMLDQRRAAAHLLETELRAAIERDEFALVYQPVVSSATQQIVGVETLLRWDSPTRGQVKPGEFVQVAEETGLIDRIGMIVLRKALMDAAGWPVTVSVNLSPAQLRNPDFACELGRVIAECRFPPDRLQLELSEAFLVADPERARRVLRPIADQGVSLALDNYGIGTASMRFLAQFPLSKIKLDRHTVALAVHSDAARVALHASIAVARANAMVVAAEGIETGAQDDLMRVAGCVELQGWLYARPMPAAEVSARLHRERASEDQRVLRLV